MVRMVIYHMKLIDLENSFQTEGRNLSVKEFEEMIEQAVVDPRRLVVETLQLEAFIFQPKVEQTSLQTSFRLKNTLTFE